MKKKEQWLYFVMFLLDVYVVGFFYVRWNLLTFCTFLNIKHLRVQKLRNWNYRIRKVKTKVNLINKMVSLIFLNFFGEICLSHPIPEAHLFIVLNLFLFGLQHEINKRSHRRSWQLFPSESDVFVFVWALSFDDPILILRGINFVFFTFWSSNDFAGVTKLSHLL